mmetsp:Transcript_35580/g.88484  ORF Transcript_35580/g.88484 Transcript_35580/m.88484 type:complete len:111 (+) Transcript_35580:592-924(+)
MIHTALPSLETVRFLSILCEELCYVVGSVRCALSRSSWSVCWGDITVMCVCVCVLCGEINQRLDMTMTMHSLSSMIEVCTYATECNKCKCPPSSYTLPPIHSFHPHSTAQ